MRALIVSLLASLALPARAAVTTVTWHGHAAFEIVTPKGKILMIDPWLKNPLNPDAKDGKDPVAAVKKLDYILITHGHFDHVGDAVALAKKTGARLVTNFELGKNMERLLGYPKEQMGFDTLGNAGGEISIAEGEVTVAFTPAVHSSGLDAPAAVAYGGNPVGFVLRIQDGPTIYHTGDTAYFEDMEVVGEHYSPDLALINIGGHFGMEPWAAAKAAAAVRAKLVVPQHYRSFPILTQDAGPFFKLLDERNIAHRELKSGESLRYEGSRLKD